MNGAHGIGARWCVAPREISRFDFTSKRVTPAFQVAGKILHIPLIGKILALPHEAFSQFAIPLDLLPHANNTGNKQGSTDEIVARSNTLGICPQPPHFWFHSALCETIQLFNAHHSRVSGCYSGELRGEVLKM